MSRNFDPNPYGAPSGYGSYGNAPAGEPLQFFNSAPSDYSGAYGGGRGLEGELGPAASSSIGGTIQGGFWSAFTPSGFPDEPPLLEGALSVRGPSAGWSCIAHRARRQL
jgi:hypothetical protein